MTFSILPLLPFLVEMSTEPKEKFLVAGIITSDEFQKCRFIVKKLGNSFPKRYETPQIRPMLDVEWEEYLTKVLLLFGPIFFTASNTLYDFLGTKKVR